METPSVHDPQTYLDHAVAGLRDDPELQRDIRAELAAHLADATDARQAEGMPPAEAAAEAVRAMGPVTDVAGELVDANRRRLRWRARIRLLLQAGLVPLAILTALVCIYPLTLRQTIQAMSALQEGGGSMPEVADVASRFPADERLILLGDTSRREVWQQQKAIWEAHPDDLVYLGNYLTHVASNSGKPPPGMTADEQLAELRRAAQLDPGNARYRYLLASTLLREAATISYREAGKDEQGKPRYRLSWEIHDRARLDAAMAELQEAVACPTYKRYAHEMLKRRVELVGPARNRLEQIRLLAMTAGVLLPDLQSQRELARASILYGQLLLNEKKPDEARRYLEAWQPMTRLLLSDSFCLIDVLVATALSALGETEVAPAYAAAGLVEPAAATRRLSERLTAPQRAWKNDQWTTLGSPPEAELLLQRAGMMSRMLLPAIHQGVDPESLTPDRLLDYVTIERGLAALVLAGLVAAMLAAAIVSLRWRWARGASSIPILLVPGLRQSARILGLGIGLPLIAFWLYSRWLNLAGQDYAVLYALPKIAAQYTLLAVWLLGVTVCLTIGAARRRCRELAIDTPPPSRSAKRAGLAAMGLLAVVCLMPTDWLVANTGRAGETPPGTAIAIALSLATLAGLGLAGAVLLTRLLTGRRHGLCHGTVARSAIPLLAGATILAGLLTTPYLRWREQALLRQDTLITRSVEQGQFTEPERLVTERLRQEMLEVFAESPAAD